MGRRVGQGEALATWGVWSLVAAATLVTYSRLDPRDLYHVSSSGLSGGVSRTVVLLNYPVALVAVALALLALGVLPARAWWVGAPAIGLCAVVAWPGVVDQADLDARLVNAVPAAGVALALGLTVAATARAGPSFAPRLPGDPIRVIVGVLVVLVSLPWIAAELGFFFPGDFFLGEELRAEGDGTTFAAVHFGRHHGLDGALLVVAALLVSRSRGVGRVGDAVTVYAGLMFAYGAVNMTQDAWFEQVVKRGWATTGIPSAIVPRAHWIWALIVALAIVSTALLETERRSRDRHASAILPA